MILNLLSTYDIKLILIFNEKTFLLKLFQGLELIACRIQVVFGIFNSSIYKIKIKPFPKYVK